jgi:hypothetical protein
MSYTNSLPPANAHFISFEQATAMAARYRLNRETILDTDYKNQNILAISETFNRDVFDELLSKTGCAGLRISYGMDSDLKVHAIFIAVNESNEDILPSQSSSELDSEEDDYFGEDGQRCPNLCPPPSPINP